MGKSKNCLLVFRVPATDEGFDLVKQMRKALNKDSYKMRTLFTGKRPKGTTQATTLKKNAESIRVYIDSKMPVSKPSDEEARSLYMEGFNKGKAKSKECSPYHTEVRKQLREREDEVEQLKKEVEEQAKRIDNSPSYNRLKEENDKLRTISFDNVNDFHDSVGRLKKEKETMRVEMIALSKSLAEVYQELIDLQKERSNAESKPVSRNNNDIDLDRIVDDTFDKWVAQKPWHKRWLYKIGSVSWRDFAFIMLAFWTIPMIVLLTLKVEGVIN